MNEYIIDGIYTLNENVTAESIKTHGRIAIELAKNGECNGFVAITASGAKYGFDAEKDSHSSLIGEYQDLSGYNLKNPEEVDTGNIAVKENSAGESEILAENKMLKLRCAELEALTNSKIDDNSELLTMIRQEIKTAITEVINKYDSKTQDIILKYEKLVIAFEELENIISEDSDI